jgi:hypothetical protein
LTIEEESVFRAEEGRVLHLAINLQDTESGYTALHRALFAGNIRAARELLLRNDCDASIRDLEGMTAFELYNGTLDGVGFVVWLILCKEKEELMTKDKSTGR